MNKWNGWREIEVWEQSEPGACFCKAVFETPTRHHVDASGRALGAWIPARGEGVVFLNESPLLVCLHLQSSHQ